MSPLPRLVPRDRFHDALWQYGGVRPTVEADPARLFDIRGVDPEWQVNGLAVPPGFNAIDAKTSIPGDTVAQARDAVLSLEVHRRAGLLTAMPGRVVGVGDPVVVGVPVGPLVLVVPCRVAWADESGFGYATLPGHPEAGVEAFRVTDDGAGAAVFRVYGFSRPTGVARLGAPVAEAAAKRTIARYLAAMRQLVSASA